jgi:hypothetical protein
MPRVRARARERHVVKPMSVETRRIREVLGNYPRQSRQSRLELGCVSTVDSNGRTIWIADAHPDDGKRFVVRADEKLTAFVELESVIRAVRENL